MNNQGFISRAEKQALKDIAEYIDIKAQKIKDNHITQCRSYIRKKSYGNREPIGARVIIEYTDWELTHLSSFKGYYFITSTYLYNHAKEIRKLNKLITKTKLK